MMRLNLNYWARQKTPVVLQTEYAECGLVCIAMVAGRYGYHVDMSDMRQRFPTSTRGVTFRTLVDIASSVKFNARPLKVDIDGLAELKLPAILHWNLNHYVVLDELVGDKYVILDPNSGRRKLSRGEISGSYTGVCLEMTPGADFQTLDPKPRISIAPLLGKVEGLAKSAGQLMILGIVIQLTTLAAPYYLQWVVDEALTTGDETLVTVLGITFGFALVFQVGLTAARSWITTTLSIHLKFQWFGNMFCHLLRLPLDYFNKRSLGDVTARFGSVEYIQHVVTTSFIESVMDGILVFVVLLLMIQYSIELTLVAVVTVSGYAVLRRLMRGSLEAATRGQLVQTAKQQSYFLETVRGIQAIRLFHRATDRRNEWTNLLAEQFNHELQIGRLQLGYQSVNTLIFGLERIVLIWLGAHLVLEQKFTIGMLVAFIGYKEQFSLRISRLIDVVNDFRMLRLQVDRLSDIAQTPPEAYEGKIGIAESVRPVIQLQDVRFQYSSHESSILKGITLEIPYGQCVCVTGPSGSGKSTLIRILLALLDATTGEVLVNGISARAYGLERYRGLFGVVMQDDMLFAGTIADNIHFFDPEADFDCVQSSAKLAGIHDEISAMPMGYRTMIGDLGTGLSGGQKQRIFLARALYKQPKILVLDEATSHLDVVNEELVNSSVAKLKLTRIIVAHRPDTIAMADRVVRLESGVIVSEQWIDQTRDRGAVIASILRPVFQQTAVGVPPASGAISGGE